MCGGGDGGGLWDHFLLCAVRTEEDHDSAGGLSGPATGCRWAGADLSRVAGMDQPAEGGETEQECVALSGGVFCNVCDDVFQSGAFRNIYGDPGDLQDRGGEHGSDFGCALCVLGVFRNAGVLAPGEPGITYGPKALDDGMVPVDQPRIGDRDDGVRGGDIGGAVFSVRRCRESKLAAKSAKGGLEIDPRDRWFRK